MKKYILLSVLFLNFTMCTHAYDLNGSVQSLNDKRYLVVSLSGSVAIGANLNLNKFLKRVSKRYKMPTIILNNDWPQIIIPGSAGPFYGQKVYVDDAWTKTINNKFNTTKIVVVGPDSDLE